jgi:hypothetical protein
MGKVVEDWDYLDVLGASSPMEWITDLINLRAMSR